MLLALLLAAAPPQDRAPLPDAGDDGTATRQPACTPDDGSITVCGDPGQSGFRNGPLDDARWAEKPLRPVFRGPNGGRGAVHAVQRSLPGASAPALMVTLEIPLGRKPKKK